MDLPPLSPGAAARAAAPTQTTAAGAVRAAPKESDGARAARDFEAAFLAQAVDEMLKTTKTGMFGGGHAEDTWRSFLARAVADQIAAEGGTGIARSVRGAIDAYQGGSALPDSRKD